MFRDPINGLYNKIGDEIPRLAISFWPRVIVNPLGRPVSCVDVDCRLQGKVEVDGDDGDDECEGDKVEGDRAEGEEEGGAEVGRRTGKSDYGGDGVGE